eukprot:6188547-Pleurochrysis_carterae.AAC.1
MCVTAARLRRLSRGSLADHPHERSSLARSLPARARLPSHRGISSLLVSAFGSDCEIGQRFLRNLAGDLTILS